MPAASIDAFIREAGGAADVRGLTRLFERVVEKFGFDVFSYHIIRSGHQPVTEAAGRRIRTPLPQIDAMMPDGARLDDDPITADALRRFVPVHWYEQEQNPKLSAKRRELYRRLHDAGFDDGIAVPVSSRPGEVAIFSFSARNRKFRFSDEELKLLQHACHAMNARWNELSAKEPPVDLSPREMEVMALVASGRSNQEIAGDLAISAHTVDTLVRRSFAKLGVTNRIEAALQLAFRGLLRSS